MRYESETIKYVEVKKYDDLIKISRMIYECEKIVYPEVEINRFTYKLFLIYPMTNFCTVEFFFIPFTILQLWIYSEIIFKI